MAVAQISYQSPITSESYREHLHFRLTKEALDHAINIAAATRSQGQVFTATLFEGASGNHRQPKPIAEGRLRVVGFPEWGTFTSDKDGNVRIPRVPSRSELLVEVTANGYYPTYKTVPTFATNVYAPIYLVSRDKVETITKFFTKSPQREQNGILMGRVFDPGTRTPKADETVHLAFRKKAIYFGLGGFPAPELSATSDNGLFAFFNVTPSFRSLLHNEQPALLAQVRPGTADFVDLGRGGKRSLSGQIVDPFSGAMPPATVKIVGESRTRIDTDEKGEFKIPEVDLPPGVLTLEVAAEGYPTTWHTLPWNTRERDRKRSLFMVEKDLVKEGAASVARLKLDRSRGSVIGGADASFFSHGETCVHVVLEDGNGNRLPQGAGPYPLKVGERTPTYRADVPLCLSRQAPGFAYYNLPPGQYLLKWVNAKGRAFRSHVFFVGVNRVSVIVD
jgi:hypothetical protein